MELYLVLLLVVAASAGSDNFFKYVVPQTYAVQTQNIPTLYHTVPTQAVKTQHVPTLYHTVPTQAQLVPTIYKVKVDDVEHDDVYKLKVDDVDDDDHEVKYLYTVPEVKPVTHLQPVQHIEVQHIRTRRSPDEEEDDDAVEVEGDDESSEAEVKTTNTHFFHLPVHVQKPVVTEVKPKVHTVKSVLPVATEVKPLIHTVKSVLPVATEVKPLIHTVKSALPVATEAKPLIHTVKSLLPKTPVNNVGTTLIHNYQPAVHVPQAKFAAVEVDNAIEVVAPHVLTPVATPVEVDTIKVDDAIKVVAPHVLMPVSTPIVTPAVKNVDFKTINPVHIPIVNTFNTHLTKSVATPIVHTPIVKNLQVEDLVNTAVQAPVQVYSPFFKTVEADDLVKTVIQAPVHVQKPTFYTTYTHPIVQPVQQVLVDQPVFKTLHTPLVQTPVQLTPGYVAANHGSLHTAPLPEGPSNDGFFASHHINLHKA